MFVVIDVTLSKIGRSQSQTEKQQIRDAPLREVRRAANFAEKKVARGVLGGGERGDWRAVSWVRSCILQDEKFWRWVAQPCECT